MERQFRQRIGSGSKPGRVLRERDQTTTAEFAVADGSRRNIDRSAAAAASVQGEALMTTQEVAEILKVNSKTVLQMIHDSELAAIALGKGFRIERAAVDDYIERHRYVPGGERKLGGGQRGSNAKTNGFRKMAG